MSGRPPKISVEDAARAELQRGKSFMVLPLSRKEYEAWMKRMENRRHVGAVTVWRAPATATARACWVRSMPRNGKWVLTYSQLRPQPGERLLPHPDLG